MDMGGMAAADNNNNAPGGGMQMGGAGSGNISDPCYSTPSDPGCADFQRSDEGAALRWLPAAGRAGSAAWQGHVPAGWQARLPLLLLSQPASRTVVDCTKPALPTERRQSCPLTGAH